MFPNSVTQASTSFSDIDLVTPVAFDDTGVFRCKSDPFTWSIDKCGGVGVEVGVAAKPATGKVPHQL